MHMALYKYVHLRIDYDIKEGSNPLTSKMVPKGQEVA